MPSGVFQRAVQMGNPPHSSLSFSLPHTFPLSFLFSNYPVILGSLNPHLLYSFFQENVLISTLQLIIFSAMLQKENRLLKFVFVLTNGLAHLS